MFIGCIIKYWLWFRYLQQNLIIKIENVEHLQQLDSLDVSNNTILGLKTSVSLHKLRRHVWLKVSYFLPCSLLAMLRFYRYRNNSLIQTVKFSLLGAKPVNIPSVFLWSTLLLTWSVRLFIRSTFTFYIASSSFFVVNFLPLVRSIFTFYIVNFLLFKWSIRLLIWSIRLFIWSTFYFLY